MTEPDGSRVGWGVETSTCAFVLACQPSQLGLAPDGTSRETVERMLGSLSGLGFVFVMESCTTRYSTIAPGKDIGTVWTGRVTQGAISGRVSPALELARTLEDIMPPGVVQREPEWVSNDEG